MDASHRGVLQMHCLLLSFCLLFSYLEAAPFEHQKAYDIHYATFKHLDAAHPRLLILFSGTPGMGKTTLSHFIEDQLQAIRLSSDESRQFLRDAYQNAPEKYYDREIGLQAYIQYCLFRLDSHSSNHLIVMDLSIDRTYKKIFKLANALGYETYVIRLTCPRKTLEQRLKNREQEASFYLNRLDQWLQDHSQFPEELVNYTLNMEPKWENLPLEELIEALTIKLASHGTQPILSSFWDS